MRPPEAGEIQRGIRLDLESFSAQLGANSSVHLAAGSARWVNLALAFEGKVRPGALANREMLQRIRGRPLGLAEPLAYLDVEIDLAEADNEC